MSFHRNYIKNIIDVIRHAIQTIGQASEIVVPGYASTKDKRLAFIMDNLADAIESLDQAWQQSVGMMPDTTPDEVTPQLPVESPVDDSVWMVIPTKKPYLQLLVKRELEEPKQGPDKNQEDNDNDSAG